MSFAAAAFPFSLNPMISAISALYGIATTLSDFLDTHIGEMKGNASATVRATGNVLEGAKFGYGLGYMKIGALCRMMPACKTFVYGQASR